jgi:glycosyltransferase involved in cell wall biosynthesis
MKVSVVITCYNYARYLSRAIRSAVNQTLDKKEFEIIVIDDASTDETQKVIESFTGWIRPVRLKKNVGLAEARNEGIKLALGRFVVNLDADDYMDENLLLVESLYLSLNPDWDAISCDYIVVDEKERHIKRISAKEKPIACGVMFKKDLLYEIGLYDSKFRMLEDEDIRIRFEKKYKIQNIELPLYRYRKHENNMTKNKNLMAKYARKLNGKHEA